MVLESNTEILASLSDFYKRILENRDFPLKQTCSDDINNFTAQVNDLISDARMQISRVKLLSRIIADRKSLVRNY